MCMLLLYHETLLDASAYCRLRNLFQKIDFFQIMINRSIFKLNLRFFSAPPKKLADILAKSSKKSNVVKKKLRKFDDDVTKILSVGSPPPPPKTLKQAEILAQKAKLTPEERLIGSEMAGKISKVGEILSKNARNADEIKSDLLKKLLEIEKETFDLSKPASTSGQENSDLSRTLSKMTIANEQQEDLVDKERIFFKNIGLNLTLKGQKMDSEIENIHSTQEYEKIDFLAGERLNLFDDQENLVNEDDDKKSILNPIWRQWQEKHLDWLTNLQPRNGFEEMIEWTEKGRMHPYPIDNEYGFHEKLVPFTDHVFLSRSTIERDERAPKDGPVRNFLDAVCIGLSKNPYMKLERKREHLEWYLEYFRDKIHLIEKMKENEDQLTE